MFLTYAWSGSRTIVDNAILTKFSQCGLMASPDGFVTNELMQ